jgi:hypothetical protein
MLIVWELASRTSTYRNIMICSHGASAGPEGQAGCCSSVEVKLPQRSAETEGGKRHIVPEKRHFHFTKS